MRKTDPSRELAIAAADLAADGKALDISILELREISSVADYFVVASGRSHIQVEAICDRIVEGVRERLSQKPIAVEGLENSQWAVLDYGSVVIHVFQEGVRKLYDLERLWSLAPSWKHGEQPPEAAVAKAAPKTAVVMKSPKKAAAGKDAAKPAGRAPAKKSAASPAKPSQKKPAVARAGTKPAAKRAAGKSAAKDSAKSSAKTPATSSAAKAASVKAKTPSKAADEKLSEAEAPTEKAAGTRSRVAAG